jgi:hypothetical protein
MKRDENNSLCKACVEKGNYPSGMSVDDLEVKALPDSQWERLHKDLTPDLE